MFCYWKIAYTCVNVYAQQQNTFTFEMMQFSCIVFRPRVFWQCCIDLWPFRGQYLCNRCIWFSWSHCCLIWLNDVHYTSTICLLHIEGCSINSWNCAINQSIFNISFLILTCYFISRCQHSVEISIIILSEFYKYWLP